MSLRRWPTTCIRCGSTEFHEIGRAEAGEVGNDEDIAIYSCDACGQEFDTEDVPLQGQPA